MTRTVHSAKIDEAVRLADEVGDYVTEEDMAEWLKSWGKPGMQPSPKVRKRDDSG